MLMLKYLPGKSVFTQFAYGVIAVQSLTSTGFNLGFSSVALPLLTRNDSSPNSLLYGNENAAIWFASIIAIAIPFGCILSVITMKAGRKVAIACSALTYIIGWIVIATSNSISQLLIGRTINGLANGLASTPAPVYLSEISMQKYRNTLTDLTNFSICLGIMMIYFLGFIFQDNWRLIAAISIFMPVFNIITTVIWLPESPRWFLNRGKIIEAKKSLLHLRGLNAETPEFIQEFNQMVTYQDNLNESKLTIEFSSEKERKKIEKYLTVLWNNVKRRQVWKPFLILNTFFFFQQFCGIYVIIAYAVDIVIRSGINSDPFMITALIGFVKFLGAFMLILFSSRMGRRRASIISGIGMTISLGVLCIYIAVGDENLSGIPITCLIIFVLTGSFGFLAIPWSLIGVIYPTNYVNILGPMTTCLAGLFNFVSIQIYPYLVKKNFFYGILFYFMISFIGTLFICIFLPETHEKSKHQIDSLFQDNKLGKINL